MGTEFISPVGRLVGGDPWKGNTTDFQNQPLVVKTGANAGQPRTEYFVQIAIPKTNPDFNAFYATIVAESRAAFPSLFDAAGNCVFAAFAFKVSDGDDQTVNLKGKRPCDREGFPGHWIVNFSGGFAPKCYNLAHAPLLDPTSIKRGDYVRISGMCNGNNSATTPGVYLNPGLIELVGYGEAITSGPDAAVVFATPAALPAGASATPLAGPGPPPVAPVPGVPAPIAAVAPVPGVAPVAVQPDPAFLAVPGAPVVAPVAPVAVPVAAVPLAAPPVA